MARKKSPQLVQDKRYAQTIQMGLGEAVKRLITVEFQFRLGIADQKLLDERELLIEAMNHIPIEIGFDCNSDGMPDTVEIFREAAVTSCCRLLPFESSKKRSEVQDVVVAASSVEKSIEVQEPEKALEPEKAPAKRSSRKKSTESDTSKASPKKGLLSGMFGSKSKE